MQKYYEIEEAIADEGWPEQQAQEAINEWLQLLGTTTGPLRAMAVRELKAKLSPESQQAIDQSQRQRHSLSARIHQEMNRTTRFEVNGTRLTRLTGIWSLSMMSELYCERGFRGRISKTAPGDVRESWV